jgi:hypothetical protein
MSTRQRANLYLWQEIDYAGYRRSIISRNPLLFDDDGDVVDEDDELEDGEAAPLEENPYQDIKLEGKFLLPDCFSAAS